MSFKLVNSLNRKMTLKEVLQTFFSDQLKRVVLVGVGNPIRGDDGVGVKIIEMLEQKRLTNVLLLNTETVPEAYTGAVTDYQPTHVLILDAANFHGKPGEAQLIPVEKIGGTAVSTHSLPLTIFARYIQKTLNTKVTLLGIQPKIIDFGAEISPEVKSAAEEIVEILIGIFS